MPPTGAPPKTFLSRKFNVQIQGIQQAIFSECSGLQVETEVFEYMEGGRNDYVHKLPGRTKVSNVTLKWGVTDGHDLWDWFKSVARGQGQIQRKNVSIVLQDPRGNEVTRWTFLEAYPVKWVGPAFKASETAVAVETLELAHRGLELG